MFRSNVFCFAQTTEWCSRSRQWVQWDSFHEQLIVWRGNSSHSDSPVNRATDYCTGWERWVYIIICHTYTHMKLTISIQWIVFLFLQMLSLLHYWATCQLTCLDLRWSRGVWRSVPTFAGNMTGAPLNDRMLFMVGQLFLTQFFILYAVHTASVIVKKIPLIESNLSGCNQRTTFSVLRLQ